MYAVEEVARLFCAVVVVVLSVVVSACGSPSPSKVAVDLVDAWPLGLQATEPISIDLGAAGARVFLGEGWHYDERKRDSGETFVWSKGARSVIEFHLGWQRDLTLELSIRPLQFPGAPPQTIDFELNGRSIGKGIKLAVSGEVLAVDLPADAQVVGRNRLVARYGRVHAPAAVVEGAGDKRELAVAWSQITFKGIDATPMASGVGAVTMPAGSRVDLFLELESGSEFRIESCETDGEGEVIYEISVLGELDQGESTYQAICSAGSRAVPLGVPSGLTRLRFGTYPGDSVGRPAGIRLVRPRILSPATEATGGDNNRGESHEATFETDYPRPNVVVYLVDALRADRLGVYGCERPLSPRLDAMAEQGITFTDVTAQSSWTKAAVASIFTGIWPREHGVNGPNDRLPTELPTLPERLQEAGYRTGAVVANAYVGRPFGFARGFDHFEFIEHTRGRSDIIGERVEKWLGTLKNNGSPFFLYVHTIDPHAPYAPPEPFQRAFASEVEDPSLGRVEIVRGLVQGTVEPTAQLGRDLADLYDAEVAANDASFGRLLGMLENMGELENTLVVFTSDHGEAFGEHGSWTHGLDLYREVLSVPLVMRLPGGVRAGQRVSDPVQHIDLLPTILNRCGVDGAQDLPGAQLLGDNGATEVGEGRAVLAYLDYWGKHGAAIVRDGWKLVQPLSAEFGSTAELYRQDDDPTENLEISAENPVRSGWLAAQLAVALRSRGTSQPTSVAPEVLEQLEALGYLQ